MTILDFDFGDRLPAPEVLVQVENSGWAQFVPGNEPFDTGQSAAALLKSSNGLVLAPTQGFWAERLAASKLKTDRIRVRFSALPQTGPLGWWHEFHGIRDRTPPRGAGVTIGVIDEALGKQPANSSISNVENLGDIAWNRGATNATSRGWSPITEHGEAVCALLAARVAGASGFAGVAPDAAVVFVAAGADNTPALSRSRLIAGIDYLSKVRKCDLISVSAGDSPAPLADLETAVDDAANSGTLCFFAAGNGRKVRYPAVYPICLAVAALGRSGIAPAESYISYVDQFSSEAIEGANVYLWSMSARGAEVDFCAPGVGVIWSRFGLPAAACFGTSFACPIAVGVAAMILGADPKFLNADRDRQRYERGLDSLRKACVPVGSIPTLPYWSHGRLHV